jgi:hypothetical protein
VLLGHGPNKAFLVPYSCGVTERNGNSNNLFARALETDQACIIASAH